jgi:hypothetical protein
MSWHNRFKPWAWTIALLGSIAPTLLPAQSPELPAGPIQAKVRTACMECHDSHIIMQQRLSNKAWSKEVDKMIKWGAIVSPNDRSAFIEYLSLNFPPDKATEPSERAGPDKKK